MKNFKRIIKYFLLSFIGGMIPTIITLFLIVGAAGSVLLIFDKGGEILQSTEQLLKSISNRLGFDLSDNKVEDILSNSVLKPMNKDKTDCEYCKNCYANDRYFELKEIDGQVQNTRINGTARLNKHEGEGKESYKNMDWIYTGWTIDDSDYWDVDFSKFSTRLQNKEGEFLFNHKVNNMTNLYENDMNKGRCTFTHESLKGYINGNFPSQTLEDTRNGTFVKVGDGSTEYLDFGNYRFKTYDGRILSAFAPMVTEGEKALKAMTRAKSYFHDEKYWGGRDESFTNGRDSLWDHAAGIGAYIDVVFEDNVSGNQVVIPFIYADAKNLHWFGSMGGRADQRYGQIRGDVEQLHSNSSYKRKTKTISAQLKYLCDFTNQIEEQLDTYSNGILSLEELNKLTDNAYLQKDIVENKIITNIKADEDTIENKLKKSIFLGRDKRNNDCFLYLSDFTEVENEEKDYYYGDEDIVVYKTFTPLELIEVQYNYDMNNNSPVQSWAILYAQTLLNGFVWEKDKINNTRPDWSLVAMRVYPGRKANLSVPAKNDTYFTELSKTFEETDSIEGNKVITFETDPNCECTFCANVAR